MRRLPSYLLALLLCLPAAALAADKSEAPAKASADEGSVALLFAQSAHAMRFEGDTLTLGGLGPATVYFSERPHRLVGLMSYPAYVDLWVKGKDNFEADPPNAALAILDETETPPAVVELLAASFEGDSMVYKVRILEGELPAESGPVSLFIDHGHHHWRGFGFGWDDGFGPWGPAFGPTWDSGFSPGTFGCGFNGLFGTHHVCY